MFLRRLYTILLVTISFVDVTSGVGCVLYDPQQSWYGNYRTWHCSDNEKCGTTYFSCIPDPPLQDRPLQRRSRNGGLGVAVFLVWFGLFFLIWCCRYYQRKQAEKKFIRRVQTAVAEIQQPRTVYIVVDTSAADAPLTQEENPPSYEETQK